MEKTTNETISLSILKIVKNSVIGNPSAKLARARDEAFIDKLIKCLNNPPLSEGGHGSQDEIRIEAAHVISSLSYGSQEALGALLRANALQAFLRAISKFQPSDSVALRAAFARALRALAVALADIVGPSQWGLHVDTSDIRKDSTDALEYLFQLESLDTYLALLVDTSPQTSTSIAHLLGAAVRNQAHRRTIVDWLPRSDRMKEVKGKRGWEKPDTTNVNAPGRQGGWVVRNLTIFLRSRDSKLQEAALLALAALAKDTPSVAAILAKSNPMRDGQVHSPLSSVISLCKSRYPEIQLAACLCATHIIRSSTSIHPSSTDTSLILPIIHVANRVISSPSDSRQNRTKACFILSYLVTDNNDFCRIAIDHCSAEVVGTLAKSLAPPGNYADRDDDEPESLSCLREAALTAIAALSLTDHETRREFTELIPVINVSLLHRHVGIRYAACQCARTLSRAVAVVRTNIIDSGLGMTVLHIFKKQGEDRRVTYAALLAICNLVNEFSPLRPIYLEQGVVARLLELLNSGDVDLRLSSLWAIKNLLCKTSIETKKQVMDHLTWRQLAQLLGDPERGVQEQAWSVVRNLAEDEAGIDMVFQRLDTDVLFNHLTIALGSKDGDILLQAVHALANLANGDRARQNAIFSHTQLLISLRSCLGDARAATRQPAMRCVLELIRTNPKRRKELVDVGIVSTLKRICEWVGSGPGSRELGHSTESAAEEKEVVDLARMALDWFERTGDDEQSGF